MRRLLIVAAVVMLAGSAAVGQSEDRWNDFRFLLGEWAGVGKGSPGEGAGTFSFELGLDGKVLIRKSHSTYPNGRFEIAPAGKPDAFSLYIEGDARRVR
jgi:hypothetical protein